VPKALRARRANRWAGGLVASSALCFAVVAQMFRLPWHQPLIAVMFSVRRYAMFAAAAPA
jgi:hypothetical protein